MSFSYIGVAGFFAISGYLVMQSLTRSKSLKEYFFKRILRIYPALLGVLVITVLLGVFVFKGTFTEYFQNKSTWTYIPLNLSLFKFQYSINGIFEDNPFKSVINGSLCTLPYEMMFYFLLAALFFFKSNSVRKLSLSIAISIVILLKIFVNPYLIAHNYPFFLYRAVDYSGGFIAGAMLALFKAENFSRKSLIVVLMVLLWIGSVYFQFYKWTQYLVLPVVVIAIGSSIGSIVSGVKNRIGDLSYGIYIYAFPVQQTLEHFFKLSTIPLIIWGVIVTIPFALLSWHLIEKRALLLKNALT